MAQDFGAWAAAYELSTETLDVLKEAGFASVRSCRLLMDALIQKTFGKAIPLGQILMLQEAVAAFKTGGRREDEREPLGPSFPGPSNSEERQQPLTDNNVNRDPDVNLGGNDATRNMAAPCNEAVSEMNPTGGATGELDFTKICQLLDERSPTDPTGTNHEGKGTFDPFTTNKSTAKRHYDIRDFVMFRQNYNASESSNTSLRIGDFNVILNDRRPSLETITQAQYMEASMKILQEIIDKDNADMVTVSSYVGYITKIACMAQTFTWASLLTYDTEYHKLQVAQGFQWGSDDDKNDGDEISGLDGTFPTLQTHEPIPGGKFKKSQVDTLKNRTLTPLYRSQCNSISNNHIGSS
ncbi:uncharacterized protein LOC106154069 [Lingula anatina]|uniref:Uncharacterized protein LOC106154069 n=1 Tax=Lingula anatina TaxID=7574 RepID=A0A1S3HFE4_LINAN|nr:uncharacterized protein LOC106154069 [Lingula anatina]|eukprot:XP_013383759.1 uncharacterized protein LOC106154069 [Lingula anatina]